MALNAARDLDVDHRFAAATTESFIHDVMAAFGLSASDARQVARGAHGGKRGKQCAAVTTTRSSRRPSRASPAVLTISRDHHQLE
jgi:hypothetical protein